jgi:hypothetical protein
MDRWIDDDRWIDRFSYRYENALHIYVLTWSERRIRARPLGEFRAGVVGKIEGKWHARPGSNKGYNM